MKTSVIPDNPSENHLKTLASHFNVKYGNMLDLACFRSKKTRPLQFRRDHGQLHTSIDRQLQIFQLILENSHPAPGQDSSMLLDCEKIENLAMKLFLKLVFAAKNLNYELNFS